MVPDGSHLLQHTCFDILPDYQVLIIELDEVSHKSMRNTNILGTPMMTTTHVLIFCFEFEFRVHEELKPPLELTWKPETRKCVWESSTSFIEVNIMYVVVVQSGTRQSGIVYKVGHFISWLAEIESGIKTHLKWSYQYLQRNKSINSQKNNKCFHRIVHKTPLTTHTRTAAYSGFDYRLFLWQTFNFTLKFRLRWDDSSALVHKCQIQDKPGFN